MTKPVLEDNLLSLLNSYEERFSRIERALGPRYAYTLATRPAAADVLPGTVIFVSDANEGDRFQGSDGATWVSLG